MLPLLMRSTDIESRQPTQSSTSQSDGYQHLDDLSLRIDCSRHDEDSSKTKFAEEIAAETPRPPVKTKDDSTD